ncbi:MAG: DEAD/DEAH box helicase [Candidatus Melainabacteria bacterium]|nr:DEAD/DEAH box helicase [Candidatus Melainabacteria bacterium]
MHHVSLSHISVPSQSEAKGAVALPVRIDAEIEIGDCFLLSIDASLVEVDYFFSPSLDLEAFETLFPAKKVVLQADGRKSKLSLTVDRQSRCLSGKDLAKYLKFDNGANFTNSAGDSDEGVRQLTLTVVSLAPLEYQVDLPVASLQVSTSRRTAQVDRAVVKTSANARALRDSGDAKPSTKSSRLLAEVCKVGGSAEMLVEDPLFCHRSTAFSLQPGWQEVLNSLSRAEFQRHELFALHEQACYLDLCQPLDKLISLASLPNFVPYPHQIQAVKMVIGKFRGRGLLCDEVGLGKTIEASLVMLEYVLRGMAKRVLILTPPSLCGQWQEELRTKFGLDFVINDESRFQGWDKHPFVLASLAKAKLMPHAKSLSEVEFDLVIVDEAHHLRNRATKAWQLVNSLKKRYILFLTATPLQNSLSDLFSLVTLLKPGHLKTYQEFRKQFVTHNEFQPKNIDRLRALLQSVMIRNKRSHTNLILTKRNAKTFELDLHAEEKQFYERVTTIVRRGMFKQAGERSLVDSLTLQQLQLVAGSSVPSTLTSLAKLAQRNLPESYKEEIVSVLAAGNKLGRDYESLCRKAQVTADIIKGFSDKVIVFTRFRETHDFLVSYLRSRNFSVANFHGGMKRLEKDEAIEYFKGDAQVLVSSESGGEGRNLQFCRALINYDLPWNPMKIEQRIGRIHRLGQDRDVHIFNLAARGTAEAHVLDLLDKKINLFELVVGELDMILGELDENLEFEEVMFGIWAQSQTENEVNSRLEDLGRKLSEAKAQYLRSQEFDDAVFGDALVSL